MTDDIKDVLELVAKVQADTAADDDLRIAADEELDEIEEIRRFVAASDDPDLITFTVT